jgi:hypothetical protein
MDNFENLGNLGRFLYTSFCKKNINHGHNCTLILYKKCIDIKIPDHLSQLVFVLSYKDDFLSYLFSSFFHVYFNVKSCRKMALIEEFLDYFLTANDETRRNVNVLIKEAIAATIRLNDDRLVIGLLEFLNNDKVSRRIYTCIYRDSLRSIN